MHPCDSKADEYDITPNVYHYDISMKTHFIYLFQIEIRVSCIKCFCDFSSISEHRQRKSFFIHLHEALLTGFITCESGEFVESSRKCHEIIWMPGVSGCHGTASTSKRTAGIIRQVIKIIGEKSAFFQPFICHSFSGINIESCIHIHLYPILMKFPCGSCFRGLRQFFKSKTNNFVEEPIKSMSITNAHTVENGSWEKHTFCELQHVEKCLSVYFHDAIRAAYPELSPVPKVLMAQGKSADFQINNALSLAKLLKKTPTEVGEAILACLPENDIIAESALDPRGFIQVNVSMQYISKYVDAAKSFGIFYPCSQRKRVVVDFSSPNIAKDMHVGHLRSTIIGDALCRMYEFCGHDVHRVNHVGDWGTQFGMLIAYLKQQFPDCLENPPHISDLSIFYKASKVVFDSDPEFKHRAYAEVVALQSGDVNAVKAWNLLCDVSRKEFQIIYNRLNIKLDEYGESFYKDKIPGVLDLCETAGIITTLADGAKVIMPTEKLHFSALKEKGFILLFTYAFRNFKEEFFLHEVLRNKGIINSDDEIILSGKPKKVTDIDWQVDAEKVAAAAAKILQKDDWFGSIRQLLASRGHVVDESYIKVPLFHYPLIVQKRDGGFTYDTTDLAAIWYRAKVLNADIVRVITDVGQAGHFELINTVASQMEWTSGVDVGHIGFGLVTGLDGKRFRTRNTDVVKLSDLIDEAVSRCHEISMKKEEDKSEAQSLSQETIEHNAEVLGIAAVKYHDLKQNRASNYAFSFDKMCDLDGNSALYLLYSYVRICGIVRKVGKTISTGGVNAFAIQKLCDEHPTARALALHITRSHAFIDRALEDGMPSRVTDYVYALVCRFTDMYGKVSIKNSPAAFTLCTVCGSMVEICLRLLGIDVVERL